MAKKPKMKNIQPESKQEEKSLERVKAIFAQESIYSEDKTAKEVCEQSRFGEIKGNKVTYSLVEALYLLEKNKIEILEESKKLSFDEYLVKARKVQPNFWVRYCVFRDLRSRGYIVKTALKFGADFRVYDRGIKPGEDHAKWIVYPVHESEGLTWYDFSAKNRVAHSTRKRLLIAVIDEEEDVSYWEARWIRP
jgi:tRNA-intron endonuclease